MLITQKQLKKVAVKTQSGQFLGYVVNFEMETDTGMIEKYFVRTKNLISGLWGNSLIINKAQIISFDDDKMVVEDNVIKVYEKKAQAFKKIEKLENAEPVITSEINNR